MLDIRLWGVDILPDVAGYIFFALGFSNLLENSFHFAKGKNFNLPMILLSIFQAYEPVNSQQSGINMGPLGGFGVLIGLLSLVLGLFVTYHLCMGIRDMAEQAGEDSIYDDIYVEAEKRWKQFLAISIATLLSFVVAFIPFLAFFYFVGIIIASILLMIRFMQLMKKCELNL